MPINVSVASALIEGGLARVVVTSDSAGLEVLYNLNFSYATSQASGSAIANSSARTSSNTYAIPLKVYDDAAVGDGTFTLRGTVTVNNQVFSINTTGLIANNDSPEFIVNLTDMQAASAYLGRKTLPANYPGPSGGVVDTLTYANDRVAVQSLENGVSGTTSVAVTAYQFFTGAIPSLPGLDYLVNPTSNPNSLNSPYYTKFNTENRYFNFAANLGLRGEGATAFAAAYGGLSFHDAVVTAYTQVIGSAQTVANFATAIASIETSQSYFNQVAHERLGSDPQDLASKVVMVGYILEEAVKANVGVYARSLENFYLDLGDGAAKTGVSLVGVYGPGTFVDTHNG